MCRYRHLRVSSGITNNYLQISMTYRLTSISYVKMMLNNQTKTKYERGAFNGLARKLQNISLSEHLTSIADARIVHKNKIKTTYTGGAGTDTFQ